ncbi:hypothetical protein N3K66_002891 [Trichothecium roseum]|uniref:Uncharacterized protein n=1 Tax=Trichothecium roseum TaxID=47278 RepID=A0ACC0V3S0_9HYPO|nr:hypothetical protein N3K66_002891 [Trichothecium roseum]
MRTSFSAPALAALVTTAATLAGAITGANGKWTVDTTNGRIIGHLAANTSDDVVEFLGIPYAEPPLGELRFAPPRKLDRHHHHYSSEGEGYDADEFGPDCPSPPSPPSGYPGLYPGAQRILDYFASGTDTPQGEGCLTLNVWTTRRGVGGGKSKGDKKPILVFFYGGRITQVYVYNVTNTMDSPTTEGGQKGFTAGRTNSPFYTGKYLASAGDMVVVTVNYRTNIFGFPGGPGTGTNLGLRDQRAAVEWVRDNAGSFGGDARRITVSGQSAGGVSVDYWAYAYERDPIAHAIYASSGNAFSFPVNAPGVPEESWNKVVKAVGCGGEGDGDSDSSSILACMREVDWQTIKDAAARVKPVPSSSPLRSIPAFYPQPDGTHVFADYLSLTLAGAFAEIPVLMGNNDNEDGFYRIPAYANGGGFVPTDEQARVFLLESFTCPVSFQARARRAHDVPAWTYRYAADWPNTRLYDGSGAYHGADLHMVLGASANVSGTPPETEQAQLTGGVQAALSAFCRDPWDGLHDFGWQMFSDEEESLAVVGEGGRARVEFVRPSVYDAACSTITLGALNTPSP